MNIKIKNNLIERVSHIKFLGVTIHENLNWTPHINNLCTKVARSIGVIKRLSDVFPNKILLMLYNALILPILSYANIVWGSGYNYAIQKLHILQKKVVRIIGDAGFRDHTPPLFKRLDIMPIFDVHSIQLGVFMYRLVNNLLPNTIDYPITYNYELHGYFTRSACSIHDSRARTEVRKHSLRHAGITFWNSLPQNITRSRNLSIFSSNLKKYLNSPTN